jgi:aspartokinase/homoserine dehydrogenase 1
VDDRRDSPAASVSLSFLAYFGAKVIHPKTMQPAISCTPQIPIYIRNTFNSSLPGSRIFTTSTTHTDRDKVVCGFSSIEHMALINVEGSGLIGVPGVTKRLFGTLEQVGVNVVLISQASSEHTVTFATTEKQALTAKEAIEEEFHREILVNRIEKVDIQAPCSIIAAVGDGMSHTTGVSGRFFSALGDAKINIMAIAQGSSERNISAVVRTEDSTRALRAVHAAFRLSHTTIRIAIIGMNLLGESLLRLLESQRRYLRSTFDIDLQVCAVVPRTDRKEIVRLTQDTDGRADSITIGALNFALGLNSSQTSFKEEAEFAMLSEGGLGDILTHLFRSECTNHVIFDCTNDETVGNYHAAWLRQRVDVVTANNTGLSGSKEQRKEITEAEQMHGKQSAKYLREVTVGGGLPILKTLRTLLDSGDKIRRIDGILSVSLSYIMFRLCPPPDASLCSEFDDRTISAVSGTFAFHGDVAMQKSFRTTEPCTFSEAVKEAIALGLMEEDPTKDLNNEYTARVLMVLVRELGMDNGLETKDIQKRSETILESVDSDYNNISAEMDKCVQERVDAARARRCVLRQIASVDIKTQEVVIKIVEVPEHHIFSVTPPSCECVRLFTERHQRYPLIIQGPSAGNDSTASALLAELLHISRGKAGPRTVALSRTASGVVLRS